MKGGLNYSTIFNQLIPSHTAQEGYKSYPSFCFEFNLKGRKPTPIHAGLAISYSLNSFNYHSEGTGHFPNGENINYHVECVRLTIFPELTVGKRLQFFCNLSPYLNIIIHSSKNGTTWDYEYIGNYYQLVYKSINGSANEDLSQAEIGFQESLGLSFQVNSWFGLTFEENGSLSCINLDMKKTYTIGKSASLRLLLGVTFTIPGKKQGK